MSNSSAERRATGIISCSARTESYDCVVEVLQPVALKTAVRCIRGDCRQMVPTRPAQATIVFDRPGSVLSRSP